MDIDVLEFKGMVVCIARKYARNSNDFLDLMQEGFYGLLKAKLKYDPTREEKFTTMASYWVEKYIRVASMKRSVVHIPFTQQYKNRKARRIASRVYARTGINVDTFNEQYCDSSKSVCFIEDMSDTNVPFSCDNTDDIDYKTCTQMINDKFGFLSDSEKKVLAMRAEGMQLGEIGGLLGFSKQRANQIKNRAIEKIQQHLSSQNALSN